MTNTTPADYIGKKELTYFFAVLLSRESQKQITLLLSELQQELPGVLWSMPEKSMHITLCEIIQPKAYGQDKKILYKKFISEYQQTLKEILSSVGRINISFNTLEASQQAIIIRGNDDGSFNYIRDQIMTKVSLPTETKSPPDIIHSSIARYLKATDLEKVKEIVSHHHINFIEQVTEFKLIEGSKLPLLDYTVLKSYPLI